MWLILHCFASDGYHFSWSKKLTVEEGLKMFEKEVKDGKRLSKKLKDATDYRISCVGYEP